MGLCWPIQIPPTPKAVLVSLADQANDHGSCWPSLPGICERTCFGRTAVIEAIKWLEANHFISIEQVHGRNNRYQINLTKVRQREIEPVRLPDQSASRTSTRAEQTSPPPAPPPVREPDQPVRQPDPNHQEPSEEKKSDAKADKPKKEPAPWMTVPELVADGLTEQTAREYLAHRKEKRARLTPRAWEGIKAEIAKLPGWTNEQGAIKAMARGWQGFEAAWVIKEQGNAEPPVDIGTRAVEITKALPCFRDQTPEERERSDKAHKQFLARLGRTPKEPA